MNKIRVGIAGGTGYTGGELIRLLLQHPEAELTWIQSRSRGGQPVHSVHSDLLGSSLHECMTLPASWPAASTWT